MRSQIDAVGPSGAEAVPVNRPEEGQTKEYTMSQIIVRINRSLSSAVAAGQASYGIEYVKLTDEQVTGLTNQQKQVLADLQVEHRGDGQGDCLAADRKNMTPVTVAQSGFAGVLEALETIARRLEDEEHKRTLAEETYRDACIAWMDRSPVQHVHLTIQTQNYMGKQMDVNHYFLNDASLSPMETGLSSTDARKRIASSIPGFLDRYAGAEKGVKLMITMEEARVKAWRDALDLEAAATKAGKLAAEVAEAKEWVIAHGSPRLVKAVALDLLAGSLAAYRDERLAVERPGWQWDTTHVLEEIRNPLEEHMDVLLEGRKVDKDVSLHYLVDHLDVDCPCGGEKHRKCYRGAVLAAKFLDRQIIRLLDEQTSEDEE